MDNKNKIIRKRSISIKMAGITIIFLAIALISGCSSGFPLQADNSVGSDKGTSSLTSANMLKSNSEGEVKIDVRYLGYKDNLLSFKVVMDTHSVNLDQYDLDQLSQLADDKGNKYSTISWDSEPGGHHRSGFLIFSPPDLLEEPGTLILIINNVAEVKERVFIWENILFIT